MLAYALFIGAALPILALLAPTPNVSAHARLDRSEPASDATVSAPPEVRLWFTQELTLRGNDIVVTDTNGARVDAADARVDQADPDRKQVTVTLSPLADGVYTVTWTSSSADDGHSATETFTFSVFSTVAEPVVEGGSAMDLQF